jgi:hypothetical protein
MQKTEKAKIEKQKTKNSQANICKENNTKTIVLF